MTTITAADAAVPHAVTAFTRDPLPAMRYPWWTRMGDTWAGRFDRTSQPTRNAPEAGRATVADTPWLQRNTAECLNIVADERRDTEALIAVLDQQRATQEATLHNLQDMLVTATDRAEASAASPAPTGRVTAAEQFHSDEEVAQRRAREHAAANAALAAKVRQLEDAILQARIGLAVAAQERESHWVVLQNRIRRLLEHYNRRAATYTRGLERRRRGHLHTAPVIGVPGWASAAPGTVPTTAVTHGEEL